MLDIDQLAESAAEAFVAASRSVCPDERNLHRERAIAASDLLRSLRMGEPRAHSA